MYRLYEDIYLYALPLNCNPPMSYVNVYFTYFNGVKNTLIPIIRCKRNCDLGEYEEDLITFSEIKLYSLHYVTSSEYVE